MMRGSYGSISGTSSASVSAMGAATFFFRPLADLVVAPLRWDFEVDVVAVVVGKREERGSLSGEKFALMVWEPLSRMKILSMVDMVPVEVLEG